MKKLLSLFAIFGVSVSAWAIPQASDQVIAELLTNNKEFKQLMDDTKSQGILAESNFQEVSVRLLTEEIGIEECKEEGGYSRSGTILVVTLTNNFVEEDKVTTVYFSTPQDAKDLKRCDQ